MTGVAALVVVADASPLIGLARTGRLFLLRHLFQQILIPGAVESELCLGSSRAGSTVLAEAKQDGWLVMAPVAGVAARLLAVLDQGEAEAITLAKQKSARLLIDEARGRVAAASEGVRIFGTGAVLLQAKAVGLIPEVAGALADLTAVGYRLSDGLRKEILRRAGE